MAENQKYMHSKEKIEKHRIKKLLLIIKKMKIRFYFQKKISTTIKIRDKNKNTKRFHGEQFCKGIFPGETFFPEAFFLESH